MQKKKYPSGVFLLFALTVQYKTRAYLYWLTESVEGNLTDLK